MFVANISGEIRPLIRDDQVFTYSHPAIVEPVPGPLTPALRSSGSIAATRQPRASPIVAKSVRGPLKAPLLSRRSSWETAIFVANAATNPEPKCG
jgi:hypothetical protein